MTNEMFRNNGLAMRQRPVSQAKVGSDQLRPGLADRGEDQNRQKGDLFELLRIE